MVLVMREEYLSYVPEYKDRLEPHMCDMEAAGIWTLTTRTTVPNYSFRKNGVVFVFSKC